MSSAATSDEYSEAASVLTSARSLLRDASPLSRSLNPVEEVTSTSLRLSTDAWRLSAELHKAGGASSTAGGSSSPHATSDAASARSATARAMVLFETSADITPCFQSTEGCRWPVGSLADRSISRRANGSGVFATPAMPTSSDGRRAARPHHDRMKSHPRDRAAVCTIQGVGRVTGLTAFTPNRQAGRSPISGFMHPCDDSLGLRQTMTRVARLADTASPLCDCCYQVDRQAASPRTHPARPRVHPRPKRPLSPGRSERASTANLH